MSQSGPEVLRVACAVEGSAYLAHCAAMLHSLLSQHEGLAVRIDYMHGNEASPRRLRRLRAMVEDLGGEVSFLSVPDSRMRGLPTKDFTRKATWYRLLLPELLLDVDRVLYLDADVIVMDSLLPLWRTDLGTHHLAAVSNVLTRDREAHPASLGIRGRNAYFNAGVMLLNLDSMRREDCSRNLLEYAVANAARLDWRDQDALNVLLHDRRLPLHPRWNCMNAILNFPWAEECYGAAQVAAAREQPAIRHFEGPAYSKPWHLLADPELRELYVRHRRQTPWPLVGAEGVIPSNILRYARRRLSA